MSRAAEGYTRIKRVGAPWARLWLSVAGAELRLQPKQTSAAPDSVTPLEGSIVRPLPKSSDEKNGFTLVSKGGGAPLQIACANAGEKTKWVNAIKAASGAGAAPAASSAPGRPGPSQALRQPPKKKAPKPNGLAVRLHDAIQGRTTEAVEAMLAEGAGPNAKLPNGDFPLGAAVETGSAEVTAVLVRNGAEVGGRDGRGTTPLMKAAKRGDTAVLQILVDSIRAGRGQVAPEALEMVDKDRLSALAYACKHGHAAAAELLVGAGAVVDQVVAGGNTALLLAAGEGHERVLQSLLRAGASTGRTDREEETALMKAAAEGHLGAVDALLRHEPRQIGQQNRDRFTALHYAASVGHLAVVAALLQQGAAPRAADTEGRTPLVLAAMFGHADVVTKLLNPGGGLAPASKEEERLALAAAEDQGHAGAARVLQQATRKREQQEEREAAARAAAEEAEAAAARAAAPAPASVVQDTFASEAAVRSHSFAPVVSPADVSKRRCCRRSTRAGLARRRSRPRSRCPSGSRAPSAPSSRRRK